jgi:hypothetical protein
VVAGAAVATAPGRGIGRRRRRPVHRDDAIRPVDQQDPKLNGSVTVANEQDTGQETTDNEAQEAAELAKLAKVSKDEAIALATQAVPGEAGKVELDKHPERAG